MKEIILTQGLVAQVDDEDWERLNQYKWCAHKEGSVWYALRREGKKLVYIHHEIMQAKCMIDHIDGNGLNCQRNNMRPCTKQENLQNRRCYSKCGYKGVCKTRNKWRAKIHKDGRDYYIGYFSTLLEAARAYDAKAKELFGEFARLNFPEG